MMLMMLMIRGEYSYRLEATGLRDFGIPPINGGPEILDSNPATRKAEFYSIISIFIIAEK